MIPAKPSDNTSRRSSILKPPKVRQPLQNVDFKVSSSENSPTTITKFKRRVSFAEKKHVKEFCDLMEQGTVWDSTYEENEISNAKSNCVLNCNTSLENEPEKDIRDKLEDKQICSMNEIIPRDDLHCMTMFDHDLSAMECDLDITDALGGIVQTEIIQKKTYIEHSKEQNKCCSMKLEAKNTHTFRAEEENVQRCMNETRSTNLDGLLQSSSNVSNAFTTSLMEFTTPISTVNTNADSRLFERKISNESNNVSVTSSSDMDLTINQTNPKIFEAIEKTTDMVKQFSPEMSCSKSSIGISTHLNETNLDTTKRISRRLTEIDNTSMEFTSVVPCLNISSDTNSNVNQINSVSTDKTTMFEDMSMVLTTGIPFSVCPSKTNVEVNKMNHMTPDKSKILYNVPMNTSSNLNKSNYLVPDRTEVFQNTSMEFTTGVPCSMFPLEANSDLNKTNHTTDCRIKTFEKASVGLTSKAINSMAPSKVILHCNNTCMESDETKIFHNVSMECTEGVPIYMAPKENDIIDDISVISDPKLRKSNGEINEASTFQDISNKISNEISVPVVTLKHTSELNKTHCTVQTTKELKDMSMDSNQHLNETRCIATDGTKIFYDASMELTTKVPFSVSSLEENTVSLEKSHCTIQDADEIYRSVPAVVNSKVIKDNYIETNRANEYQDPSIEVSNKIPSSVLPSQQMSVENEISCRAQYMTTELEDISLNTDSNFNDTLHRVRPGNSRVPQDTSIEFTTDMSVSIPILTKTSSILVETENVFQATSINTNKDCSPLSKTNANTNQVNYPSLETRLISENLCDVNRNEPETSSSLSTKFLNSSATAITDTSRNTGSTSKEEKCIAAISGKRKKGISFTDGTKKKTNKLASMKKHDFDMKIKSFDSNNSTKLPSTQIPSYVYSKESIRNSSSKIRDTVQSTLTSNHNKNNDEAYEREKQEYLSKSIIRLEETMSQTTANRETNCQTVNKIHMARDTDACNEESDETLKMTDSNVINKAEVKKRKRSETFIIRNRTTTFNLIDSDMTYEEQMDIEHSQSHSTLLCPNIKNAKRTLNVTPRVATSNQRESMDSRSKISNNDQAFVPLANNKHSSNIRSIASNEIIQNNCPDTMIILPNFITKEHSCQETLALAVNDKETIHDLGRLPNEDDSIKNVESSLFDEHKDTIDEDSFVLLTKNIELYAQSDNCIWDIRCLDKKVLAVDFISGSLVVVIFFDDNETNNVAGIIERIKIVSRLSDEAEQLLSTIHYLILHKVNPEELVQSYKTYENVLPLLEHISKEVKLAVDFMYEFRRLDDLNLIDILDNRITFIMRTKRMEIILKVSIDIKPFDNICPNDIDVSCLLGNIRVDDIKQLITNVKKDHLFLKRYISDVEEYIEVMEETSSVNKLAY